VKVDPEPLRALLDKPDLAWLVDRLVQRLQQGKTLAGRITLPSPTAGQRDAWQRLSGQMNRGQGLSVDLDDLAAQWRNAGLAPSLEAAIEALRGKTPVRRLAQEAERRAWDEAFARPPARAEVVWQDLQRTGLVKRLTDSEMRMDSTRVGLWPLWSCAWSRLGLAWIPRTGARHGPVSASRWILCRRRCSCSVCALRRTVTWRKSSLLVRAMASLAV
jgi:hypothetical protein